MLSQKKEQRVEAVLDLLDKCYAAYELALARLPDTRDANLWYGIGLLYERYGALMLPCDEQRDCLHHAEQALSHVLEIDAAFEKRREICYRLGLIFKQQSDSQRALGCFAAIAEDPPEPLQIADVWFQIGHVHESVEPMNAPLAKEAYECVLALLAFSDSRSPIPTHIPTRLPTQVRAPAARRGGAAQEGARVPPARLGHAPNPTPHTPYSPLQARVYRQLGWLCHATRQRSDQSPLGHLHMAVGADADDAQNWHLLGRCLTQHGQHASAYDALQRAIAIDALAHEIWASLGALYVAASSLPDARIAYHRAVLLNPLSEAWLQLGHVLEAMHARSLDPAVADEASHAFAQALPLLPQHEREIRSAMHNLAVMRDDSRRRAAAAAAAQGPAAPRAAEAVAAGEPPAAAAAASAAASARPDPTFFAAAAFAAAATAAAGSASIPAVAAARAAVPPEHARPATPTMVAESGGDK